MACWSLVICEEKISPFLEDSDCYSLYIFHYKEGRKQTKKKKGIVRNRINYRRRMTMRRRSRRNREEEEQEEENKKQQGWGQNSAGEALA